MRRSGGVRAECDSRCARFSGCVNDFETAKLWRVFARALRPDRNAPNLLADYLYLWETTVVRQAFETARAFCLIRRTFVVLLVPTASVPSLFVLEFF